MSPFPLVVFLTLAAGPNRTTPPGCRTDYESCHEDCTIEYGGVTTKYRALTQCIDKCLSEEEDCTTRHYSLRDAQIDEPSGRGRGKSSGSAGGSDEFGDSRPAAATPRDGARRDVYRATDEETPPKPEPTVSREPERTPPSEGTRRGVYRTTDEETPPKPEPTVSREPEPVAEPEPMPPPRSVAKTPAPARKKKAGSPSASGDDGDIPVFGDKEAKNDAQGDVWPASKAAPSDDAQPLAGPPRPAAKPSEPPRSTPSPESKKKDISDWDPNAK